MSRKIKFAIILLSAVFLAWLIGQPLSEIGRQRTYDDPPSAGQKLSAAELNEFLDLWSRMLHGKLHRYAGQISLSSGKSYPGPLVKWLKLQGWDVERFFDRRYLFVGGSGAFLRTPFAHRTRRL